MTEPATVDAPVGKKKSSIKQEPKQYGTLVRVSEEFAEVLRDASSFEKISMREFADTYLLPIARKRFNDSVVKKAKRIQGEDESK